MKKYAGAMKNIRRSSLQEQKRFALKKSVPIIVNISKRSIQKKIQSDKYKENSPIGEPLGEDRDEVALIPHS